MNSTPLISVIVPVFNAGRYLETALDSIRRQHWTALELILVDSSTDGSAPSLRAAAPEARYLHQEKRGPAAARNAGLAVAQGEWVAFLDADDAWPEGTLAALVAALGAHPGALFVLGKTRTEPANGEPWVSPNFGAGLYRREAFAQVGLISTQPVHGEDIDWFLRVREMGAPYVTVDRVTLVYRRRPGSLSDNLSWREFGLESLIRASLARRRQVGQGQAAELPLLSGSRDNPRATGLVNHDDHGRPAH